jgi:hypothetical protein
VGRSLPWWLALALGTLLVGDPVGVGVGVLYAVANSPIQEGGFLNVPAKYYDAHGSTISQGEYTITSRHVPIAATVAGVAAGLLATAAVATLLTWWRIYRFALFVGLLGSAAVLGTPAGVLAGNLFHAYFRPESPIPFPSGTPGTQPNWPFSDYQGRNLTWVAYQIESRDVAIQAVILGLATGITLTLAGTAVFLWRYSRRRTLADQAVSQQADELAAEFPDPVRSWGGAARLRERAFVEQALQSAG